TGQSIPTLYTVKKQKGGMLADDLIDPPEKYNPMVSAPLSKLVMEMIRTRKEERPADMDAVITRLELAKHVALREAGKLEKPIADFPDPADSTASPSSSSSSFFDESRGA